MRLSSYRKVWEHLHQLFPEGRALFGCHSWLLYPKMQLFLPESMNLIRFQKDFCLVDSRDDPGFHDDWRLYGEHAEKPLNELPRDTLLRRLFAEWLEAGGTAGIGMGFFYYDGEKFEK